MYIYYYKITLCFDHPTTWEFWVFSWPRSVVQVEVVQGSDLYSLVGYSGVEFIIAMTRIYGRYIEDQWGL